LGDLFFLECFLKNDVFSTKKIASHRHSLEAKMEKKLLNPVRKLQNFYGVIYIYVFYLQFFNSGEL
jgi:hypothetical protein